MEKWKGGKAKKEFKKKTQADGRVSNISAAARDGLKGVREEEN